MNMKKLFIVCLLAFTCLSAFAKFYIDESGAEIKASREKEMPPAYFKDPVGYLEKWCDTKEDMEDINAWALNDYAEVSLSLSLYYLGFPKEILLSIYNRHDSDFILCPVPNFKPLLIRGKIRDAKKAYYWMKRSYEFSINPAYVQHYHAYFLREFKFEGLGGEIEQKKVIDNFLRFEKEVADENRYKQENAVKELSLSCNRYIPLLGYMFYKGIGLKQDIQKAKIYADATRISWWKNFYTGYAAPLDQEYALFILRSKNAEESKKILADIERGVYDKKAEQ